MGDQATAIDAQFYHLVWFLRGCWVQGPVLLLGFPKLEAWETRIANTGHGEMFDLSAEDAIKDVVGAQLIPVTHSDPHDPQGLTAGMRVVVSPDVDEGVNLLRARSSRLIQHVWWSRMTRLIWVASMCTSQVSDIVSARLLRNRQTAVLGKAPRFQRHSSRAEMAPSL